MTFLVTQAALEKEKNLSKEGATPTTQNVEEKVLVKEKFLLKKKKRKKRKRTIESTKMGTLKKARLI